MPTLKPLDVVTLRRAQEGLSAGAVGTVLEVYPGDRAACLVEFCRPNGETERLLELPSDQLGKAA